MKKLPNFLIVGAAKSGTSTVNYYLDNHYDVFMTYPKEPKFFSYKYAEYKGIGDVAFTQKKAISTISNYENLFKNVTQQKVIGEASVDSLFYHDKVIPDIKNVLGDPKIIIMLRHPVDRAISAYSHLVRDGREHLSFEEALEQESKRLDEGYEFIWGYKKGGLYYNQVKSYLENFSQVKILFFDDFKHSPQKTLNQITSFLDISSIEVEPNLRINASGKSKYKFINTLISKDTLLRRLAISMVGRKRALKLKTQIQKKNTQPIVISQNIKRNLNKTFKDDIIALQSLLDKDLSNWLTKY